MTEQVQKLYSMCIVDASFIGLDSTPVAANTKQNNPKSFVKTKFSKENHPRCHRDCALGVHSVSNQHNEQHYEFCWGYRSHVLVDCIYGLLLYELTTLQMLQTPPLWRKSLLIPMRYNHSMNSLSWQTKGMTCGLPWSLGKYADRFLPSSI